MKKEYIEPRISVVTCSSEQIMLAGTAVIEDRVGRENTELNTSTEQEDPGSKFNSGMSWDEEE